MLFFDAQSQPNPQLRLQGLFPPMIGIREVGSVSAQPALLNVWSVYLIRDKDNRLYTGITTDVARRILTASGRQWGEKPAQPRPINLALA